MYAPNARNMHPFRHEILTAAAAAHDDDDHNDDHSDLPRISLAYGAGSRWPRVIPAAAAAASRSMVPAGPPAAPRGSWLTTMVTAYKKNCTGPLSLILSSGKPLFTTHHLQNASKRLRQPRRQLGGGWR